MHATVLIKAKLNKFLVSSGPICVRGLVEVTCFCKSLPCELLNAHNLYLKLCIRFTCMRCKLRLMEGASVAFELNMSSFYYVLLVDLNEWHLHGIYWHPEKCKELAMR